MEAILRGLCEQHGLTTISIMHQFTRHDYTSVYLHWGDPDEGNCVSAGGKTFDEALAAALAQLAADRHQPEPVSARYHHEGAK